MRRTTITSTSDFVTTDHVSTPSGASISTWVSSPAASTLRNAGLLQPTSAMAKSAASTVTTADWRVDANLSIGVLSPGQVSYRIDGVRSFWSPCEKHA